MGPGAWVPILPGHPSKHPSKHPSSTLQAHFKHTSSTLQAPAKHTSSTPQAHFKPSTPPWTLSSSMKTLFWLFFGIIIFDYDFDAFFDWILLDFWSIFGPLVTPEICVAPTRELDFHFFDPFFRGHFPNPKMTPKLTPKFSILAPFLAPRPLPESPGAILDAVRALRELLGSSLKLLNNFKIDILTLLGALGTLLGPQEPPKTPQEPPKTPKWSQNGPKMVPKWSQNCPKMVPKLSQNDFKIVLKWSENKYQKIKKLMKK